MFLLFLLTSSMRHPNHLLCEQLLDGFLRVLEMDGLKMPQGQATGI